VITDEAPPFPSVEWLRELADWVESPGWHEELSAGERSALLHRLRERLAALPEYDNVWPVLQYRHGKKGYKAAIRFQIALDRVINPQPPGEWAGQGNTRRYRDAKRAELVAGLRQVADLIEDRTTNP
jgi:hypothetical protein